MASILDKYGIKEVADFTFYHLSDAGLPDYPVLYLDTLKVSTMEQTGDTTEAKGGKGNVDLISWDYNKQITVNIEDALFSAKSMAIMFGNGKTKAIGGAQYIMKSEVFTAKADTTTAKMTDAQTAKWDDKYVTPDGTKSVNKVNPKFYDENGVIATKFENGKKYFCSYDLPVAGSVIEISANSFPSTYYCTGDTFARNQNSGKDEFFQLIIPRAKVQAGNTITMQADGDPSTFKMDLKVLRPDDGVMVRLVKYDVEATDDVGAASSTIDLVHNHELNTKNTSAARTSTSGTESGKGNG